MFQMQHKYYDSLHSSAQQLLYSQSCRAESFQFDRNKEFQFLTVVPLKYSQIAISSFGPLMSPLRRQLFTLQNGPIYEPQ